MTTLAARGSGTPTTNGTTWANTANAVDGTAGTNPATYTTYTNATASAVGYIEIGGYNFSSSVGASDTLNSVTVNLRHFENNTGRFASVRFQPYDGATAIGTIFTATLATGARNDSTTFPVTLAQLRSSTFKIRVTITGAASTQSRVESIDHVDVTADYTIAPPAITQAAYRFYADGTETGATALAAQDTGYTADTSSGDVNLQVRARLQSTTAIDVPATDDWQLQWEKNTSGAWTDVTSDTLLLDSYPIANGSANNSLTANVSTWAQSFLGNGDKLARARFTLTNSTGTGTITAVLYAHTGTFGTSGVPTGSVLATSTNSVDVTSIPFTQTSYVFDFDGTFTLAAGTPYFIGVRVVSAAVTVFVRQDNTAPTHAGNTAWFSISGGTWTATANDLIFDVYTSTPALADSYAETNTNTSSGVAVSGQITGQSFLGNGSKLQSLRLWGYKTGTGGSDNVVATLYAHTGTFGSTGTGTGSALATSAAIAGSAIAGTSADRAWNEFTFDGTYVLAAGTPYVIGVGRTGGSDGSNYFSFSVDSTSPTHAGCLCQLAGTWSTIAASDVIFELYTSANTVLAYASANLTDAAATTNRLGAGTGSFVAGKVSEDGLVDDLGWTANNYTEVLYSVTLKQADLAPTDTLRFRVLRNGATTDLTYTQYPSVTIAEGEEPPAAGGYWGMRL